MRLPSILIAATAAFALVAPAAAQLVSGSGRIEQGRQPGDERPRIDHRITLQGGERVRIAAESEEFDAMLEIYRADDLGDLLAHDDDSGGDLNPRLSFTAPESGAYVVRVLGFSSGATGEYSWRVDAVPPLPAPRPVQGSVETTSWQVVRGSLGPGDPEDDAYFHDYVVTLAAGEELLVRMDAADEEGDLDPLVRIYRADQRGGEALAYNDDSGGTLNSFLIFRADQAGDYIVRATSYASAAGDYVLRIGR